MMALFRRVGTGVADDLGYAYPFDLDDRVTEYVQVIKDLDRGSGPDA